MLGAFTQWSTAAPLITSQPTWVPDELDRERLASYALYDEMYWNVPDAFRMTQRGSDASPIYLPNPRTIIEGTNRFLAVDMDWAVDPTVGTDGDQTIASGIMRKLFAREKLYQKLSINKRFGLIRGDAIWHVVADPSKPQGSRISIYTVDPGAYFPIEDPDIPGRVVGCHLVTQEQDPKTKMIHIRRRTYRKIPQPSGVARIQTSLALYEQQAWDDRNPFSMTKPRLKTTLQSATLLPPEITALPVYHVRNMEDTEAPFGSSELRGFELLQAAVNQSISDEDYALVMQGLGMFWTNSGPPVDSDGNEINWRLGPGRVVEVADGSTFGRVAGVGSLSPTQDHITFVLQQAYEAVGLPDVARGKVDVSVAESGISLALQLAPMLSKNHEKEQALLPVLDHMMYDLMKAWYPAYEATGDLGVEVGISVGDPMPRNRQADIDELLKLVTAKVISAAYARQRLVDLGFNDIPDDMDAQIQKEALSADPFSGRLMDEVGGG